jgi:hypothetical protein
MGQGYTYAPPNIVSTGLAVTSAKAGEQSPAPLPVKPAESTPAASR